MISDVVETIRKRFDILNIKYVSIGQFSLQKIWIFVRSKEDCRIAKKFLTKDEENIVVFSKI